MLYVMFNFQLLVSHFSMVLSCWTMIFMFNVQVKLLKDTLEAWKREVEKKPPSMSIEDAYEVLNLPKGQGQ